jgi:phosphoserine aminotransferase
MSTRTLNFNAGPGTLPLPALERAQRELTDFAGSGMSVMEHSHRGKDYEAVHDEAVALVRELLSVPPSHEILFLQGGATQQFAQLPLNFLEKGRSADYVVTGAWGEKAVSEGRPMAAMAGATLRVAASTAEGQDKAYRRTPAPGEIDADPHAAYFHFTSNETIHGVEYFDFPSSPGVPLVADMSSDILWRPIDVAPFAFLYAGAQKNIGPSGVVLVIAQKEFIARGRKDIPKIFQYRVHAENNSLYNTPPTFGIYLVRNVLAWVKEIGGLVEMERRNREKARALYGAIDARPGFYRCPVEAGSRSVMNVVFRLPSEALEDRFVAEAKKRRMVGLKGHRSVGGIRVSTYNAVPIEWVNELTAFMAEFAAAQDRSATA